MQSQNPQLTSFIDEGLFGFLFIGLFSTHLKKQKGEERLIDVMGELEWNKFLSGALF